MNEKGVQQLSS